MKSSYVNGLMTLLCDFCYAHHINIIMNKELTKDTLVVLLHPYNFHQLALLI